LSFEYFISKRILRKEVKGNKVSRPIIRIAVISISLAVVVNLLTLAVVKGFQNEVKTKVAGFGASIFITNNTDESIYEANPITIDANTEATLTTFKNIKYFNKVAYKAVLLQSDKSSSTKEIQQEIQGCIFKGIDSSYNWSFFKQHLTEGTLPQFKSIEQKNEILISSRIANDLHLKLGDRVRSFFVKNKPVKRYFKIVGIYNTGLEEFDKKMIIGNIEEIQKLNDWGIQASILISDSIIDGNLLVKSEVIGGNGNYRYDWGEGYSNYKGFTFFPKKDTLIRLIVSDYWSKIDGDNETNSLPDTAYLEIKVNSTKGEGNFFIEKENIIQKTKLSNGGFNFNLVSNNGLIEVASIPGKGSFNNYISGYEINIDKWDNLSQTVNDLKRKVEFTPNSNNELLKVSSIIDNESDIFTWLSFLDVNVVIILTLMIIIGIINMGSTLLVLILVRTNFIGIMKTMGATDWSIRKIFLIQGSNLILRGIIWGNAIGLSIYFLQSFFQIFKLNPSVYFLDHVPVELSFTNYIVLNITTFIVCTMSLLLPSYMITKISPSKAVKFN